MEIDGPAIRALGSLFKLTEVYIWDDGLKETREVALFPESNGKSRKYYGDSSLKIPALTSAPEDADLIEQMGALGLPLSFQSNKEIRNKISRGKRKGTHLKLSRCCKELVDEALESTKVSEVEIVSHTVLHDKTSNSLCCMSMLDQSESYYYDVAVDISDSQFPAGEDSASSTNVLCSDVFDGIGHGLLSNDHECEFVTLNDVMSNDENNERISSKNSGTAPSLPCWLTDAIVDNGKELVVESLEHNYLEDPFATYDGEKHKKKFSDNTAEQTGVSEIYLLFQNSEVLEPDGIDSCVYSDDLQDWRVYWDSFYMRNYFHNIKTGISTWDPPACMEHIACDDVANEINVVIAEVTENNHGLSKLLEEPADDDRLIDQPSDATEIGVSANSSLPGVTIEREKNNCELQDELCGIITSCDDDVKLCLSEAQGHIGSFTSTITEQVIEADTMQIEIGDPATDRLDIQLEPGMLKWKKKAKKARTRRKSSNASEELQCQETFEDVSANSGKYWCQRYMLFSRFDSGIKMDKEGWFSATPELIARHHASRCADDIMIDCFTGVGGNAIQFALRCKHVTAIDIDPKKVDYAYHNAAIYGVDDRIDFIKGDFFLLAPKLKAGTVFLSPPWGGPDYAKVKNYSMAMLRPRDGYFLFNTAKKIARKIFMFLPRNVDLNQLAELSLSDDPAWSLEVEKNFLNGKLKAITAYFIDTTVEAYKSS